MKRTLFLLSIFLCTPFVMVASSDETKQEATPVIKSNKGMFKRGEGFWSNVRDEGKEGFFSKLTNPKSQRENWYAVSPYIAEFWCAISNAGFIYVGIKKKSPELVFAGIMSMASHSVPKQWLLMLDKLGVLLVLSKVAREYKTVVNNPWFIVPVAVAVLINGADAYLARSKGYTWPHVVWHLSAAVLSYGFLHYAELKNVQ